MTGKPTKTTAELTAMLMAEVRKHPECSNITSVGIARPARQSPHEPNWAAAWTVNGPKLAPPIAFEIERRLRRQFDLV